MRTAWTDGLPAEKKAGVEEIVRNSTIALGRLRSILEKQLEELLREDIKIPEKTEGTYSLRVAHRNGQRQMALKILDLLDLGVK